MISGAIPKNEAQRLAKLRSLEILDTLEEQAFDDLTFLAAQICDVPITLVSLADESRQWFKSRHGLDATETPREYAFCGHAIHQDSLLIVEDAALDERFKDNPLVTGDPKIRFYAGAPLILEDNIRIGTLCVIDREPRVLTEKQKLSIQALSRQVVAQLKLRNKLKEMRALDEAKDEFLAMVSHELRTPMTSLHGSLRILEHESLCLDESVKPMLDISLRNSDQVLKIINDILDLSAMQVGKLKMKRCSVNLVDVVKNSLELNQVYIDSLDCEAQLSLPEGIDTILVEGDEQRLLQVSANLISNAAKQHPGTGLGLSITKHILEAHESMIEFESLPDKQTRFYFKLPLID